MNENGTGLAAAGAFSGPKSVEIIKVEKRFIIRQCGGG